MRCSSPVTAISVLALLTVAGSVEAAAPPGCKRSLSEITELENSLKREIQIPYDANANPLKSCDITQPVVTPDVKRSGKPGIAIFVLDVTSTGRVVGLQLIGKTSQWAEIAQEEVSQWLFEPLVEADVGITRVGVTVAVIAELEGRGQQCGTAQSPVKPDLEVRVCASR